MAAYTPEHNALFELPPAPARSPQPRTANTQPPPKPRPADDYGEADRWTYLGTHMPSWLARPEFGGEKPTPLCISHRRLAGRKTLPRAVTPWMLDSGAYSELYLYGRWTVPSRVYARNVRRFADEIGDLDLASIQDWMCEPHMIARTGLSVEEHQERTIRSYLELMWLDDTLPWMPVLQGYSRDSYLRHRDLYARYGIDLTVEPRVGLGSVCRRQNTTEAIHLVETLHDDAHLRLHAFGFKIGGLRKTWHRLYSSDSMAWSYNARRSDPLASCRHAKCTSCPRYALQWRLRLLNSLPMWNHIGTLELAS
ncbi:hypothetical protein ACFC1B_07230 [Streptomyces xiamenensis]|uniref:deazapurine DNA modification protein DpdA family protein n=1 Tax=Streptomyces xiamenensis TaxID=408015 RepID=UPI0035DA8E97